MLEFARFLLTELKSLVFKLLHRKMLRDEYFYVITCDSIGDIMMTLGCLHKLRSRLVNEEFPPYKKIAVITSQTKRELAELYSSQYDKLICVPPKQLAKWNNRLFICPRYEKKFLICYPSLYIFDWIKYIKHDPVARLLNIIRFWLFEMKPSDAIFFPDTSMILQGEKNVHIKKGKSVILCPFANSLQGLDENFFAQLSALLLEKGFDVYTNCGGSGQTEILGTEKLCCGFAELLAIANDAGFVVGIRSGILDWLSLSDAKIIALYPDGQLMNFFDIKTLMDKPCLIQLNLQESAIQDIVSLIAGS